MPTELITGAGARVTMTPNATMTTLASPTQGGAATSLWRVDLSGRQSGPPHIFNVEQTWHLISGAATVAVDGHSFELAAGDTLVVPPGATRQVSTAGGAAFIVSGASAGRATPVTAEGPGNPVAPAWIG